MRAALVGIDFGQGDFAASVEELQLLARSAGAEPVTTITAKRSSPDAAYFVGSGKADEIGLAVLDHGIEIVIFNHALSPAQQRNLEKRLNIRVLDRTSLILDIFAQGGIGLRGPGETQLETDRRLIGERVKALRARLGKLRKQHETQRRSRGRSQTFSVSLVGYTNAGKSTLFNALTKAGVYVADQLFATLDTTSRRVYMGQEVGNVVVSDTVGFVRELPHQLVAAFRATLEETIHADLLLHVVDASSPVRMEQIEQVNLVLKEIGADHIPQILVWNKIDAAALEPSVERDEYAKISRVFLSARTGLGVDLMREAIVEWAKAAPGARLNQAYPVDQAEELEELEEFEESEQADRTDEGEAADGEADSASDAEAESSPTPTHVGSH
jgi:GTP-binding protein HflX